MKNKKLLFFLTNDDGIYSEGLKAMWKFLKKMGEVCVVVPETERSATGHSINLSSPLRVRYIKLNENFSAYITDGTPADCVKIGIKSIMERKPDFVISGINLGPNLGMDILYSGTVSAAAEGAILGIPSIAVSIADFKNFNFELAGRITITVLKAIIKEKLPPDTLFNINIPNLSPEKIKGFKLTYQSKARFEEWYEKRIDPRGIPYYWLKGNFKEVEGEKGSDVEAVKEGYVSITPIYLDLTDYKFFQKLKSSGLEEKLLKEYNINL